jgi:hypothetical protein
MARSDKRYSIYPSPKAVDILGNSSPQLNQAIECWASLIARATADNAKRFQKSYLESLTGDYFPLHEWCVLADALRERRFDPEFANPAELLATAVEDADRFENIGSKWFSWDGPGGDVDVYVQKLAKKVRELKYPEAWAVIIAVQWYWENSGNIDLRGDPWWTLGFRRSRAEKQAGEKRELSGKVGERPKKSQASK